MEQEKVWDAIAMPWQKFRNVEVSHISDFLEGKCGRILDLGCGSGRNFSKRNGLEFYGVDFSQKMVDLARERGIAKEVRKSDVSLIPYGDEFFDNVIFNAVLHCVDSTEKRKKALEEIYRVLSSKDDSGDPKSGGEALVSVWGRGQERMKNREKEGFVPWTVGDEKVERYTYLYDVEELRKELEDVGFEIVKVEDGKNIVFVVRKG